jgi:hypothetical protein
MLEGEGEYKPPVRKWLKEAMLVWFDDGKYRTKNGRNNKNVLAMAS